MIRALIGNGGHAREVMAQMGQTLFRFVDDEYCQRNTDPFVLPLSEFNPDEYEVMIAVGDSNDRKKISDSLPRGTKYFTYIHPSAMVMNNCLLGKGTFIGANCILTCDIEIGDHAILNRGVQIGHDCKIGNFFSAMPGSIVSGNVEIGDIVYLGTNSSVREKIKICNNVLIGLNSGVVRDLKKEGTYVGLPAKIITQ